jgi:hypothetical protein
MGCSFRNHLFAVATFMFGDFQIFQKLRSLIPFEEIYVCHYNKIERLQNDIVQDPYHSFDVNKK